MSATQEIKNGGAMWPTCHPRSFLFSISPLSSLSSSSSSLVPPSFFQQHAAAGNPPPPQARPEHAPPRAPRGMWLRMVWPAPAEQMSHQGPLPCLREPLASRRCRCRRRGIVILVLRLVATGEDEEKGGGGVRGGVVGAGGKWRGCSRWWRRCRRWRERRGMWSGCAGGDADHDGARGGQRRRSSFGELRRARGRRGRAAQLRRRLPGEEKAEAKSSGATGCGQRTTRRGIPSSSFVSRDCELAVARRQLVQIDAAAQQESAAAGPRSCSSDRRSLLSRLPFATAQSSFCHRPPRAAPQPPPRAAPQPPPRADGCRPPCFSPPSPSPRALAGLPALLLPCRALLPAVQRPPPFSLSARLKRGEERREGRSGEEEEEEGLE